MTLVNVIAELLLVSTCGIALFYNGDAMIQELSKVQFQSNSTGEKFNISSKVALIQLENESLSRKALESCSNIPTFINATTPEAFEQMLEIEWIKRGKSYSYNLIMYDPTDKLDCEQMAKLISALAFQLLAKMDAYPWIFCRKRDAHKKLGNLFLMERWPQKDLKTPGERLKYRNDIDPKSQIYGPHVHRLIPIEESPSSMRIADWCNKECLKRCKLFDQTDLDPIVSPILTYNWSDFTQPLSEQECGAYSIDDYDSSLMAHSEWELKDVIQMNCTNTNGSQKRILTCKKAWLRQPIDYLPMVLSFMSAMPTLLLLVIRICSPNVDRVTKNAAIDSTISTLFQTVDQSYLGRLILKNFHENIIFGGRRILSDFRVSAVFIIPLVIFYEPIQCSWTRFGFYASAFVVSLIDITWISLDTPLRLLMTHTICASFVLIVILYKLAHRPKHPKISGWSWATFKEKLHDAAFKTWLVDMVMSQVQFCFDLGHEQCEPLNQIRKLILRNICVFFLNLWKDAGLLLEWFKNSNVRNLSKLAWI